MAAGFELGFDAISYTLIALVLALLVLPAVFAAEPDIHPYALLRQSIPSSYISRSAFPVVFCADVSLVFATPRRPQYTVPTRRLTDIPSFPASDFPLSRNIPHATATFETFGSLLSRKATESF